MNWIENHRPSSLPGCAIAFTVARMGTIWRHLYQSPGLSWALCGLLLANVLANSTYGAESEGGMPPSYARDVLPILRANCQGCHQPAHRKGAYDMTSFATLLAGGESGTPAIVAGQPDQSPLIHQITPNEKGEAAMPQGKPPLSAPEIDLIRKWIQAGANNDEISSAPQFDSQHPPTYPQLPVVTAMDISPDGKWIAVSGHHEVLLHAADGSGIQGRLIGLSERIESVRFSPDGTRLAVAAGLPGRLGEIQIWDVAKRELLLSRPHGRDTLYGASWSPDGKLVAFGSPDNSIRVIEAATGKQVLFQGAHDDWPLDTNFSLDGSHLISAGRDRAVKLIEVATQRFVDNITSITPGVLKGGIAAVRRHPQRDEIAVASADGIPKVYGVFRQSKRVIGDDANLRKEFPAMPGRVISVAFSHDGQWLACASSDLTAGEVSVFSYPYVDKVPDDIKAIQETVVTSRSPEQNAKLDEFNHAGVQTIARVKFPSGMYAVAFHPQSKELYAAGLDGMIRIIDASQGKVTREFPSVPVSETTNVRQQGPALQFPEEPLLEETSWELGAISGLEVVPDKIAIHSPHEYVQSIVTATLADGSRHDVTRRAKWEVPETMLQATPRGRLLGRGNGEGKAFVVLGDRRVEVPVVVSGFDVVHPVNMEQHVMPVLSRLGCNQGTCHGAKDGKNGFKLSLRGYDALYDARALTDELKARRTSRASAESSLFLLKATGSVPHVGGQLTRPGESYYELLRQWVQEGAVHQVTTQPIVGIEVEPAAPLVHRIGDLQQMRVLARLADGTRKDVTYEAFIDSGNTEVAKVGRGGLVTSLRRGEAPMLARYQGNYAVATLTVMGERKDFEWQESLPAQGEIDKLVNAKLQRMKILPSGLCNDAEFLRRVYLDLTGLPPNSQEVEQFLADGRPSQEKREKVIDLLVGSDAYIDYWTNKWCDLLMVNSKYLASEGATSYRDWIRGQIASNVPYDEFVRQIVVANGSNRTNPPAAYYKILREPQDIMENTTQLFLAVRFNCNKCHDHPFERWTQDQYYETAAYFARVGLQKDDASGDRRIGGSAVESAKPLYEVVYEKDQGEVVHDRTKLETAPEFPFACDYPKSEKMGRREEFAAWLTSPHNPYFAKSFVNRMWGYLFGVGIIEPIDDIRAGNPPSNPELLDYLTRQFVAHQFDTQKLVREICKSQTYQRSVASNTWNDDDRTNYSHALPRRLPAEVLFDTLHRVAGSVPHIPGVPAGTRAAQLPDVAIELPSGFLASFGRPPRESACECERSSGMQLGPVMALVTGPTVGGIISDPKNKIAELVQTESDDRQLVREIFLRVLGRAPEEHEVDAAVAAMQQVLSDHIALLDQVRQREVVAQQLLAEQKMARAQEIAEREQKLKQHQAAIAPERAQREAERVKLWEESKLALGAREMELQQTAVPWEASLLQSKSAWERLFLQVAETPKGAQVVSLEDQSLFLSGNTREGDLVVTAPISGKGITGLRLELLSDPRLPQEGPGHGAAGSFVISEVVLEKVVPNQPNQPVAVKSVQVSYTEPGTSPAELVDGKAEANGAGWRVERPAGTGHVAVLELGEDWNAEQPQTLRITLKFMHREQLAGRIRWAVTREARPLGVAVPWHIRTLLEVPREQRSDLTRQALITYQRATDAEYQTRLRTVREREQPLPPDPTETKLASDLAELRQKDLPGDPVLASLQHDLALSQAQVENLRLTAAQDLVWALINTPSFLFNR